MIKKILNMKLIYIAAPLGSSGDKQILEQNVIQAITLSNKVINKGYSIICPHTMTLPLHNARPMAKRQWLLFDFEIIRRCDAILFAQNWEISPGCWAEFGFARALNIPIFYQIDDIPDEGGNYK